MMIKSFYNDINLIKKKKYDDINISFYKDNFFELLFEISLDFFIDNYKRLYDSYSEDLSKELLRDVFRKNVTCESFNNDCFLMSNNKIINLLAVTQYFEASDRLLKEPLKLYGIIRDSIINSSYEIVKNKIVINGNDKKDRVVISISSFILLILRGIENEGQSFRNGDFEFAYIPFYKCFVRVINVSNNNKYSPSMLLQSVNDMILGSNFDSVMPKELFLDALTATSNYFGEYDVYYEEVDKKLLADLGFKKVSEQNCDLYVSYVDKVKDKSIKYREYINLLCLLYTGDISLLQKYDRFLKILR